MKRLIFAIYIALGPLMVMAQENDTRDWARRGITIKDVVVYGKQPMKEIGTQQTKFDTLVLKENISLSMADVLTFNSSIFVKN